MIELNEILNRIKYVFDIKKDKEIADLLEVKQQTLTNWKNRNKTPYEEIISLCLKKNLDIKYILTGEKTNLNNNINNSNVINGSGNINSNNVHNVNIRSNSENEKVKILEVLEKLPEKRQKYYYHIISAEAIELEE